MKKVFFVSIIFMLFFLVGCSQTQLTSYIDPDFKDKTFTKLMVFANIDDLGLRDKFERTIVKQFVEKNINAVSSIDIFPPTRKPETEEIPSILEANQIDGVLQFEGKDVQESTKHIKGYTSTDITGTIIGNNIYADSTTYNYGGYDIKYLAVSYDIKIIDAKTFKTAWMATANTRGTDVVNIDELIKSFGKGLLTKLQQDNMVPNIE